MKSFIQLTLSQLIMYWRDKKIIFWSISFPIVLMLVMGTFIGKGGESQFSVAIVDKDKSDKSNNIIESFENIESIQLEKYTSEKNALEILVKGKHQIVVVLPQDLEKLVETGREAMISVYYNETKSEISSLVRLIVKHQIDKVNIELQDFKPVINVNEIEIEGKEIPYINYLVPGLLALMIMNNNLIDIVSQITAWRNRGVLKRLQIANLNARTFIASQITSRLTIYGTQALLILLVARMIFGITVEGSWNTLIVFIILGILVFMSMGFIIASLSTPETASSIAGFFSLFMIILGGVFFPIEQIPEIFQRFLQYLPLAQLSGSLREIINNGASFLTIWPQFFILLFYIIIFFIVSSLFFKWS